MLIDMLPPTYQAGGERLQIDHAQAVWDGRTFSASSIAGSIPSLARKLIAAGCPDQPWRALRNGALAMFGPSLATVAGITFSEAAARRLKVTKYRPYPRLQPAQ